eukprot:1278625-Rhodomonas_salina.1
MLALLTRPPSAGGTDEIVHPLTVVGESAAIAVGTEDGDDTEARGLAGPPRYCIRCCFHPAGGAEKE